MSTLLTLASIAVLFTGTILLGLWLIDVWENRTWFRQRDIMDRDGEELYLRRWYLIGGQDSRWGGLMLHQMHLPDNDACHHDHPWSFLTLILWGGYVEHVTLPDGRVRVRRNRPGTVLYRPAEHTHRIDVLPKGTAWTLVLRFRKRREWGFHTQADGWIPWRRFIELRSAIPWCESWDPERERSS